MTYRFTVRLLMITLAAMLVAATYQLMPALRMAYLEPEAEPRVVTARGDLAAEEQATIELFQSARDSVVFISTAERVRDPWSRHVYEQPRGTGSGFLWDNRGHVVTNTHVIEGASAATVRLARPRLCRGCAEIVPRLCRGCAEIVPRFPLSGHLSTRLSGARVGDAARKLAWRTRHVSLHGERDS